MLSFVDYKGSSLLREMFIATKPFANTIYACLRTLLPVSGSRDNIHVLHSFLIPHCSPVMRIVINPIVRIRNTSALSFFLCQNF